MSLYMILFQYFFFTTDETNRFRNCNRTNARLVFLIFFTFAALFDAFSSDSKDSVVRRALWEKGEERKRGRSADSIQICWLLSNKRRRYICLERLAPEARTLGASRAEACASLWYHNRGLSEECRFLDLSETRSRLYRRQFLEPKAYFTAKGWFPEFFRKLRCIIDNNSMYVLFAMSIPR